MMLEFISDNITILVAIGAGVFSFIQWLDTRNRELENKRHERFLQLIRIVSGSERACVTEQIAAAWLLLEYPKYYDITLRAFDNFDLKTISPQNWQECVLPQIKEVVKEIKSRS